MQSFDNWYHHVQEDSPEFKDLHFLTAWPEISIIWMTWKVSFSYGQILLDGSGFVCQFCLNNQKDYDTIPTTTPSGCENSQPNHLVHFLDEVLLSAFLETLNLYGGLFRNLWRIVTFVENKNVQRVEND